METNPAPGRVEHWLTRKEAAKRLGISPATLGRLVAEGRAPRRTVIRRRPVFSETAIAEFIATQTAEAQWRSVTERRPEPVAVAA